jgi:hypothetical protein
LVATVLNESGEALGEWMLALGATAGAVVGALGGATLGVEAGTAFPLLAGTLGAMFGSGLVASGWYLLLRPFDGTGDPSAEEDQQDHTTTF